MTGENLDLLRAFPNLLSGRMHGNEDKPPEFQIDQTYSVPLSEGVVVCVRDGRQQGASSRSHFKACWRLTVTVTKGSVASLNLTYGMNLLLCPTLASGDYARDCRHMKNSKMLIQTRHSSLDQTQWGRNIMSP